MDVNLLNKLNKNTLAELLEIEFISFEKNQLSAKMPVNEKTRQPFGYLHGGASLALAETIASSGSYLIADPEKESVFGIQVSCNHVASIKEGFVIATANLIQKGKRTHIWDVKITDNNGKNISLCRVTNKIVEKK
jgi:1,4-dihydroxy-2-naphthoyl-CoA hydrolase